MNPKDEIARVREFCSRMSMPMSGASLEVTPRMIGSFYDNALDGSTSSASPFPFMNFGYWESDTTDVQAASENLLRCLTTEMPSRTGTILDVACGAGASARYLSRYWAPERVVGINASRRQIERCQRAAPACQFAVMDAASMGFADESFDNIVCVEAAFHFNTRQQFFKQAFRVLRRGGVLAMTDVLLHERGHDLLPMWLSSNFVSSPAEYRGLLLGTGFASATVIDVTAKGWRAYADHEFSTLHQNWMDGRIDFVTLQEGLRSMYRLAAACKFNVMCFATK